MVSLYKVTVWFAVLLTCLLAGRAVFADEICGLSSERLAAYQERIQAFQAEIRSTLRAHNVDEKFIWLAIIESGGDTNAKSERGAIGLWQLTSSTSKHYGCPPESRHNVVCSTRAAAKYLSKLLRDFNGDKWKAIVGYNMGGSNYRKLGRPTDEARHLANTVTCLMENYEWNTTSLKTSKTPY